MNVNHWQKIFKKMFKKFSKNCQALPVHTQVSFVSESADSQILSAVSNFPVVYEALFLRKHECWARQSRNNLFYPHQIIKLYIYEK